MTRLEQRYNELVASGWGPEIDLPFVEVPTGDGFGTWFTWTTAGGVNVALYDSPNTAPSEVHGAILVTYQAQQGPLGSLGYPISDEYDDVVGSTVVGRVSDFERGSIFWSSADGQTTVMTTGPVTQDYEIFDGVDVSYAQGKINWDNAVNHGGVQFAYIKATEGDNLVDNRFNANWSASSGRLPRGAYHFFRPRATPDAALDQANNFVGTLNAAGGIGELPPMVDVEDSGVPPAAAAASLQFFLSNVAQSLGREPIIYTFPSFWRHQMGGTAQFDQSYKLWIANYGKKRTDGGYDTKSGSPVLPPGWSNWAVWQHAVQPGVAGIATLVDRDIIMVPTGTSIQDFLTS